MNVVHVSAHIGGGVGSVLKGFFDVANLKGIANTLICLDKCNSNFNYIESAAIKKDGAYIGDCKEKELEAFLNNFDVIVVHYWNHPLMCKFLTECRLNSGRLVFWCHNSGLFEPHIFPRYLVNGAKKILFTSCCSYEAPNLRDLISKTPEKFGAIHSTRNLEDFERICTGRNYDNPVKNLLYVGTINGSKMHLETAKILAELSNQGFSIQVIGGPDHERLASDVCLHGGMIEVFGEVEDVAPYFEKADLFIYPLRPDHYGTGEQVILEAMASGLPVIAFDNPAERAILENGGGVLVSDSLEFIDNVVMFKSHPMLRKYISEIAVKRVKEEFYIGRMTDNMIDVMMSVAGGGNLGGVLCASAEMDELALYVRHSFFDGDEIVGGIGDDLSALEDFAFEKIRRFMKISDSASRWTGLSKSSPFHYQQYFIDNVHLNSLCQKIIAECAALKCRKII